MRQALGVHHDLADGKPGRAHAFKPNRRRTRMMSLDVFRGLAVAAMVLVNNPGDDQSMYAPLLHSAWNGFSLADQVFPSFLFIVGASLAFSAVKEADTAQFIRQVSQRSVILFALGLMINGFPYYHLHTLRIYGVLQRIALTYGVSALAVRWLRRSLLLLLAVAILLGYWILLEFPGGAAAGDPLSAQGNVVAMVDHVLLAPAHLYSVTDPEGLLSTLPAVVNALIGYLAASWIREQPGVSATAVRLAAAGIAIALLGYLWSFWLPINKQLWTSSFTLLTAGICLIVFALLYQVIEIWRWRRWAQPLSLIGASALVIYIGCEIISVLLIQVPLVLSIQQWILHQVFLQIAEPKQASLLYSLVELTLWTGLAFWLHQRRIAAAAAKA